MLWERLSFEQQTKVRLQVENHIKENIPGFAIIEKKQSLWMKTLDKILFFTPDFMDRFVTTWYPKVFIPNRSRWEANNMSSICTVCHEYVHLRDRKRLSLLFNFAYLFPQALAPLALFYTINPWFLLFLLCLLPIPSLGRTWAEIRGYRMTMAVFYWLTDRKYSVTHIAHQFVSSNYYWMFPFRGVITRLFNNEFEKIKRGQLTPELSEIKNVLTAANITVYNRLV